MSVGIAAWVQEYKGSAYGVGVTGGLDVNREVPLTPLFVDLEGGIRFGVFEDVPLHPRPFLRGGVMMPTNGTSTVMARSDTVRPAPAITVLNSPGLAVEWNPIYTGAVGVELELPGDLGIRISPSLEFRHTRVRYDGSFQRVELRLREEQSRVLFRVKQESGQSYLGPGLRAAVGFAPFAGVTVEGYLDGALLWDLEGTRERFGGSDPGLGQIEFTFEAATTVIEIGTGLSLVW